MVDAPITDWPAQLRPETIAMGEIAGRFAGPKPLGFGAGQTWASDAGTWRIRLVNIPMTDLYQRIRAWRAVRARMLTIQPVINIPLFDQIRSPRNRLRLGSGSSTTHFSDTSTFDDTTVFSGDATDCTLAADSVARSTSIRVNLFNGIALGAGDLIGFGGDGERKRAHMIGAARKEDDGTFTLLGLWPTIRLGLPAGTRVETENPMVACVLTNSAGLDLEIRLGLKAVATPEFAEAPDFQAALS